MQTAAKIFLAEERGVTETPFFRSYHTLNVGDYFNEYKTPVEDLYVCNDDTLAGAKNIVAQATADSLLLLLPIVGAVNFSKNEDVAIQVNAGEILCDFLKQGETIEIVNPYTNELISFLQLWIKADETNDILTHLQSFNIDACKNKTLTINLPLPVSIAKFDGRHQTIYKPRKQQGCLFAFVIQGAFEAEGILLHPRDGAAFWNYSQLEIEALSNDAIIFLVEI